MGIWIDSLLRTKLGRFTYFREDCDIRRVRVLYGSNISRKKVETNTNDITNRRKSCFLLKLPNYRLVSEKYFVTLGSKRSSEILVKINA